MVGTGSLVSTKLLLLVLLVGMLGFGVMNGPSPASAATGTMAVDCDAPGPGGLPAQSGVQSNCVYAAGATFGVEIHVTPPTLPDSDGYFAFQTKLRWADFALQYNPTGFSTADEKAGGWPNCDIAGRDTTNPSPVPNTETVLFFCQPNPTLTVGSTHTGMVIQHEFRCETDSLTTLTLVPRPGDFNQGSHFNDALFQAIEPSLLGATITCGTPDLTPPETTIDSGPSGVTNDTTPTFTFSSNEVGSTFECRVDGAPFGACSGPGDAHTTAVLAEGPHTFEVRATDASNNTDPTPASRAFTVDTTAPGTTIDSGPTGLTNDSTPTFTFSSNEGGSGFECRVDADAFASCSPPHTVPALSDGAHTFEVRATDPAGNTDATPASHAFTVDATPPETTIDSGPSGVTGDTTPTYAFSANEGGSTFECRVDANPFAACTSPETTAALADGPHTFEVRATDAAGNTDASPATRSIIVDTGPPETTIDSGPSDPTNDTTPEFTFSSSEAGSTFECRVDAEAFASCTSPHTTAILIDGPHTFEVRAIDAAGTPDATPASSSFTVATAEPETTIDSGPTGDPASPEFTFSSNEAGATFECRVDDAPFAPCTSPHTVSPPVSEGAHTFEVRATDPAGNTDPTPAIAQFAVPCGGNDSDCDGFSDEDEKAIGTDIFDDCAEPDVDPDPKTEWHQPGHPYVAGDNAWPPDGNNDGATTIGDIGVVVQAFGGSASEHPRRDLVADGSIVIGDIGTAVLAFGQTCGPPPPEPTPTPTSTPKDTPTPTPTSTPKDTPTPTSTPGPGKKITVNTTKDELNSDGDCSLREAIEAANKNTAVDACTAGNGADTITLPAGTYALSIPGTREDANASADLDILDDLTIDGAGAVATIIDGGALETVLHVLEGNSVEIAGVTVRNGDAGKGGGNGGGILNYGTMTLNTSIISGNSASAGGGGILSFGTLTINNSTVSGNSVQNAGGGVYNPGGTLTINNSTVSDNTAGNAGGGIYNHRTLAGTGGKATLNGTTVSGNSAGNVAGGIDNAGALTINNSTISGNSGGSTGAIHDHDKLTINNSTIAGNSGVGIGSSGSVSIKNTILANSGAECAGTGTFKSDGYNLSDDSACGLTTIGDLQNTDPELGPLQDNGGPSETHALLAGSPAIDASRPGCPPPATDQRGFLRPVDGDGDTVARCDIGAFEFGASPP